MRLGGFGPTSAFYICWYSLLRFNLIKKEKLIELIINLNRKITRSFRQKKKKKTILFISKKKKQKELTD